ncbi:COX15/CtaA family protein [Cerasicoccus fimbriatus]|uniref:COX15/CtaA family protein n=1 Tax=Cerasicoccus fimbriatus TaxID=3014554 RepID=UPI0022B3A199|nr:COX15/CtaA family protein [Cerasicoccus sp. TK19100]
MPQRQDRYHPALFWFALFALGWSLLLLYAGAYTTSIQAGMVFLDWPLSNSSVMPEGWWEDIDMRAEHSHRLLGAKLGFLSIVLAAWAFFSEGNRTTRRLAYGLLALVIGQGLLGGLRVMFDQLNTGAENNAVGYTFRILHALGAEFTLCWLATLTLRLSRWWREKNCGLQKPVAKSVRAWGIAASVAIIVQILLGALMRHAGAGLAIPTFPLTPEGGIFPATWTTPVTLHWLHRLGAVVASVALLGFLGMLWGRANTRKALMGWIIAATALLAVQIFLGAATVLTHKNPVMASSHMLVGALLLANVWTATIQTFRLRLSASDLTNSSFSLDQTNDTPKPTSATLTQ